MANDLIAKASTTIDAPEAQVWDALVKPGEDPRVHVRHFSPMSGQSDVPENDHKATIELSEDGAKTNVTLSQDNNATEQEREHSQKNWTMMLDGLKKFIEQEKPS